MVRHLCFEHELPDLGFFCCGQTDKPTAITRAGGRCAFRLWFCAQDFGRQSQRLCCGA